MKKIYLLLAVSVVSIFLSGCVWFLWHGQILAKSNQRLDFGVYYILPNTTIYVACLNASSIINPESEDPVLYFQHQWLAWVGARVDTQGHDLPDSYGQHLGSAITKTGATPTFTDSSGTPIYAATFNSIRFGADSSPPGQPDACWATSGYGMDNRAPYKAKIIAYYADSQGNIVHLNVYTQAESNCIGTQIGSGASVVNALAACGNPTRKVLHLYANQFHAPL